MESGENVSSSSQHWHTSTPVPEPEAEPNAPEPEPEVEPNAPALDAEINAPDPNAEPDAPESLQLLWCFHYYIFGTIFICLACYALYSTLRPLSESTRSSRRVSSIGACILAIKLLLVIMGGTRALYMFLYRKYTEDHLGWKITHNILQNIAYPCLTGGFGLMCQILYEASRLKTRSRSTLLANKIALAVVITSHFVAVITAVTLIELVDHFLLTLLVCHGFFIVWGVFLIVTFILFSRRLLEAEKKSAMTMADIKEHENLSYSASAGGATSDSPRPNDQPSPRYNSNSGIHPNGVSKWNLSNNQINESFANGVDPSAEERQRKSHHQEPSQVPLKQSHGMSNGDTTADKKGPSGALTVHGPVCRPFRVKLTRKVMRIATATAVLATCSVALNSLVVISDVVLHFYGWRTPAVVEYVFTTLFRCVELGMGFTMAYFTTQSIKGENKRKGTWLKRILTQRLKRYRTERTRLSTVTGEPRPKTTSDSAS